VLSALAQCGPAGFCKQQLWPLFHYILPMTPSSSGRFDSELWQAYVKANKVRSNSHPAITVVITALNLLSTKSLPPTPQPAAVLCGQGG
jgi:hypothetical protein